MTAKKLTEAGVVLSTTMITDLLAKIIFLAKKKKPSKERGDTEREREREREREKEEAEKNGKARKHIKQLL
jgi:hypothetical protein